MTHRYKKFSNKRTTKLKLNDQEKEIEQNTSKQNNQNKRITTAITTNQSNSSRRTTPIQEETTDRNLSFPSRPSQENDRLSRDDRLNTPDVQLNTSRDKQLDTPNHTPNRNDRLKRDTKLGNILNTPCTSFFSLAIALL